MLCNISEFVVSILGTCQVYDSSQPSKRCSKLSNSMFSKISNCFEFRNDFARILQCSCTQKSTSKRNSPISEARTRSMRPHQPTTTTITMPLVDRLDSRDFRLSLNQGQKDCFCCCNPLLWDFSLVMSSCLWIWCCKRSLSLLVCNKFLEPRCYNWSFCLTFLKFFIAGNNLLKIAFGNSFFQVFCSKNPGYTLLIPFESPFAIELLVFDLMIFS